MGQKPPPARSPLSDKGSTFQVIPAPLSIHAHEREEGSGSLAARTWARLPRQHHLTGHSEPIPCMWPSPAAPEDLRHPWCSREAGGHCCWWPCQLLREGAVLLCRLSLLTGTTELEQGERAPLLLLPARSTTAHRCPSLPSHNQSPTFSSGVTSQASFPQCIPLHFLPVPCTSLCSTSPYPLRTQDPAQQRSW